MLGFGEDSINASAILVMPMVSSKYIGFRGNKIDRAKIFSLRNAGSSRISMDRWRINVTQSKLAEPVTDSINEH